MAIGDFIKRTGQFLGGVASGITSPIRNPGQFLGGVASGITSPIRNLGRTVGDALSLPFVSRSLRESQEQTLKAKQDLLRLASRYKQGSPERERIMRLAEEFETDPEQRLREVVPSSQKTARQVAGEAVGTILTATVPFRANAPAQLTGRLASRLVPAGREAGEVLRASRIAQQLARRAPQTLRQRIASRAQRSGKDFVLGAAFSAAQGAEEGASTQDIATQGAYGGAFFAALPPAAGLLLKGVGFALRGVQSKVIRPIAEKGYGKLQELAFPGKTSAFGTELERSLSVVATPERFSQRIAQRALRATRTVGRFKQVFLDRFHPFKPYQDRLQQVLGRELSDAESIYMQARQVEGRALGRAVGALERYHDDVLEPYRDVLPQLRGYLTRLDAIARKAQGKKTAYDALGERTVPQLTKGLLKLEAELGPAALSRVKQGVADYNRFSQGLLKELMDAGVVSKATHDSLLAKYPNYIPHKVVADTVDDIAEGFGITKSINVGRSPILRATGSERMIEDPFVTVVARLPAIFQAAEKNRTLSNVIRQAEKQPDIFKGFQRLAGDKPSVLKLEEQGLGTIDLFRQGVKEKWTVPRDIEIAVKALDPETVGPIMRVLSFPAKMLRAGATRFNLSFSLTNWFRDIQTAAVTSSIAADGYIRGMARTQAQRKLAQLYRESGGLTDSIFREYRRPDDIYRAYTATGWKRVASWANPLKVVEAVNEGLEKSTRLNVFRGALQRGLSPRKAAFEASNATVDFSKMGTLTRDLNRVIPFLNARLQGALNIGRAAARNPETFARVQMWTAALPTVVLYNHNRQFESYEKIPQYFKNRYWIIMTGEVPGRDSSGNAVTIPQFVTVVKGEGQQLVSNPLGHFLEKSDGLDPRTTGEMLADTAGSLSPLGFQTYSNQNGWLSMLASLGPLATVPVGLATNVEPFTGQAIVPEERLKASPEFQVQKTTPEAARQIGRLLDVSPAQVEFVLGSFGGLPTDVLETADVITKGVPDSLSETRFGTATRVPLLRRFFRETTGSGAPHMEEMREELRDIERDVIDEELLEKDQATKILDEMLKLPPEERRAFLSAKKDAGELTRPVYKRLKRMAKTRQTVDVLKPSMRVEVRARFIAQQLVDIPDASDRRSYLSDLKAAGILTRDVYAMVGELMAQSGLGSPI